MSTHKIITIILIILAIFLGISVYKQNKQGTLVVPTNNAEVIATTTISTSTTPLATTTPTTPTTPTKPTQTFPKQITLSSVNYYEFPDGGTVSLKQINDSRCAVNVNCIWAGNVIAIFNLKKGNMTESFELKFGAGAENSQFNYGDYKIKIMNVLPERGIESQIMTQKDYKVTIMISKL